MAAHLARLCQSTRRSYAMKPLAELDDPELKPRAGGLGVMLFGFLAFSCAVIIITIAALSAREQDGRIDDLEREIAALRTALADSIDQGEALADAIATVAVEHHREERR